MGGIRGLCTLCHAVGDPADSVGGRTHFGDQGTGLAPESQAEQAEQRRRGEHENGPDQHPDHGCEGIGTLEGVRPRREA